MGLDYLRVRRVSSSVWSALREVFESDGDSCGVDLVSSLAVKTWSGPIRINMMVMPRDRGASWICVMARNTPITQSAGMMRRDLSVHI
ncbi:MAG: hypothetical protein V1889_01965 [archaeon]